MPVDLRLGIEINFYMQAQTGFFDSKLNARRYKRPVVLDPFSGCGTVQVQAKLNGFESYGTELNPLLHFIASTKLDSWNVSPGALLKTYNKLSMNKSLRGPLFLKSGTQFDDGRPATQSDFNDNVVRLTLEDYLIHLFKSNRYIVVSQGEPQKLNPLQKVIVSALMEELNFFLSKKGYYEVQANKIREIDGIVKRVLNV